MDYVLWFNRCKGGDRSLGIRLSSGTRLDLVRFVAWSGERTIRPELCVCICDRCKRQLSLVLLRCTEHNLDAGLDAEPVLIERTRRSEDFSNNNFVHYSFAHPSTLDTDALLRVLLYTEARFLYVTTTYDTVTKSEDPSVFKINLVKRKTPDCEMNGDWMATRIRAATSCKANRFETRYVSYLSPFTGDGCTFERACETSDGGRFISSAAPPPCAIDSLRGLLLSNMERTNWKRRP